MAVYARGYRPYEGNFSGAPAWWVIQDTACRNIMGTKSAKVFLGIFALLFLAAGFGLYFSVGVQETMQRFARRSGAPASFELISVGLLRGTITGFYFTTSVLSALFCMFSGSGLIADDIRHRALSLYLVRPIRPIDYAIGKAIVLPKLLFKAYLLPGLLFFVLTALWQEEASVTGFMGRHIEIVGELFFLWVITSLGVSGVMLILSSRSSARGPVMALAAGVFFVGILIQFLGRRLDGFLGEAMRHAGVVINGWGLLAQGTFGWRGPSTPAELARRSGEFPSPTSGFIVALLVFAVGLYMAMRRAESAEISE